MHDACLGVVALSRPAGVARPRGVIDPPASNGDVMSVLAVAAVQAFFRTTPQQPKVGQAVAEDTAERRVYDKEGLAVRGDGRRADEPCTGSRCLPSVCDACHDAWVGLARQDTDANADARADAPIGQCENRRHTEQRAQWCAIRAPRVLLAARCDERPLVGEHVANA